MGYTHYWTVKRIKGEKIAEKYKTAILQCQKIVRAYSKINGGIAGYNAHTKPGQYGGLNFNGRTGQDCESFTMPEHYSDNFAKDSESFNFCKTRQLPYDCLVVASLIVLKHYLGNAIEVSSDGDKIDWGHGLQIAQRVLKLKTLKIPDTIRNAEKPCRLA